MGVLLQDLIPDKFKACFNEKRIVFPSGKTIFLIHSLVRRSQEEKTHLRACLQAAIFVSKVTVGCLYLYQQTPAAINPNTAAALHTVVTAKRKKEEYCNYYSPIKT